MDGEAPAVMGVAWTHHSCRYYAILDWPGTVPGRRNSWKSFKTSVCGLLSPLLSWPFTRPTPLVGSVAEHRNPMHQPSRKRQLSNALMFGVERVNTPDQIAEAQRMAREWMAKHR